MWKTLNFCLLHRQNNRFQKESLKSRRDKRPKNTSLSLYVQSDFCVFGVKWVLSLPVLGLK